MQVQACKQRKARAVKRTWQRLKEENYYITYANPPFDLLVISKDFRLTLIYVSIDKEIAKEKAEKLKKEYPDFEKQIWIYERYAHFPIILQIN